MIEVSRLAFTYPGGSTSAVDDLTFQIAPGEVFGFLGPSGAGKSTTLNILIGLLRGWTGNVRVAGRGLGEWGSDYYRRIGVSFEYPNHYLKLTARENLEYFRSLHGGNTETVDDVLSTVSLEGHADQPVLEFSKGMKMRLNLARSLLHRPDIWFLDEPTTGLDPVNAVRIRELIRARQRSGTTILVATHDMNTAEAVCDRLAFIVDGKIAAIDAPAAFRRRHGERIVEVRWESDDGSEATEQFPLEGLSTNIRFLELLRSPGLSSIHSQEATLEDVFVQVTGSALR
jgi:fluoroquinolone transport system ATP-binding protein